MPAQDPTVSTESNGGPLATAAVVFLILSWLSVILRTYVRAIMLKGFRADDWLMLIAQINYTLSCAFILVGCYYGVGRHNRSLDQHDEILALEYQALATATYISDMMFIKLSIGIFLLRIATQKRYIYLIYGSIFIIVVWSVVLFFWNLFQCHPVQAQWDYTILLNDPNSACVDAEQIVNAAYALSVLSVVTDWFYALIPIPMVWQVKMTTQAKVTVMMVLGLGVFASIATLIRLKFLADLTDLADILFAGTDAMIWTLVEPGVAIIASSLATIRPMLRAWKIRGFQTTENSKRTPRSYGIPNSNHIRSNGGGAMPGFGSKDVTLVDVEAARGGGNNNNNFSNNHEARTETTITAELGTIAEQDRRGVMRTRRVTLATSDRGVPPTQSAGKTILVGGGGGSQNPSGAYRYSDTLSEEFVIEGGPSPGLPDRHGTWPSSHSASSSEVELSNMQPVHMQSDGKVGLGSPRSENQW